MNPFSRRMLMNLCSDSNQERLMRVFLSWSGERSRKVAEIFRDWLPSVLQNVTMWMSQHDIDKGSRWSVEIAEALDSDNFGIVCLTPENLSSPWINFESGALSKAVKSSKVWTYLYKLTPSEVDWPLAQFQHTATTEEDTLKLVQTINRAGAAPLTEAVLIRTFDKCWPDLRNSLEQIPPPSEATPAARTSNAKIDEILELTRGLSQGLAALAPANIATSPPTKRPLLPIPVGPMNFRNSVLAALSALTPEKRLRLGTAILPLLQLKEGYFTIPPLLEKMREEVASIVQEAKEQFVAEKAATAQQSPPADAQPASS
jgi:hypothetical protein